MPKMLNQIHLVLVIVLLHSLKGSWCFFLRHSSGWCVRTAPNPFLTTSHVKAWYLELTNQCAEPDSQFHFTPQGVLTHVASSGCVLPLNGKLLPSAGTSLVVLHGQRECVNETRQAYIQTLAGSLRHFSGKCVQPHTSFQSVPSIGAKLEYSTSCNTSKQEFVLGSVTCEGERTSDLNCPSSQVILVNHANYGGYGYLKTCSYIRDYNCKLPSSLCQIKRRCDGLQSCEVEVATGDFHDDPCAGVSKYLYVEYKCVNRTVFKDDNMYVSSIRLVSRFSPGEGHVEIREQSKPNTWQRLCVRNWKISEQEVMCRSLGYSGVRKDYQPVVVTSLGSSSINSIHVDIYCHGDSTNISSCCLQKITTGGGEKACAEQVTQLACTICTEPIFGGNNRPIVTFTASNSIPWYTADQVVIASNRSWCGVGIGDYIELDLGEKYVITQLSTLGDQSRGQAVTLYEVYYAAEKNRWTQGMTEGEKIFQANTEGSETLASHSFTGPGIIARFLKIVPKTWLGQACMRLELCGHKLLPDAPQNLTISRVTSSSAHLAWHKPTINGDNSFTNYRLSLSCEGKLLFTNISNVQSYHYRNLRPFTKYSISVQAGNKHGYGRNMKGVFKTISAVPSGPPTNIQVAATSARSLTIEWQRPHSHHLNGVLKGYEICVTGVPSSNECDRIIRTQETQIPVSDLKTAHKYKVKILVKNDVGLGDYGPEYFQITNAEAPVCNHSSITRETFQIKLQKPRNNVDVCKLVVLVLPNDSQPPTTSYHFPDPVVTYFDASESLVPVPYVTAQFAASDFSKYGNFVLGDAKIYPVSSSENPKTNQGIKKYFNGPLSANTKYTVVQKFYSKGKLLYSSDFLPPVKTLGSDSSHEKLKEPKTLRLININIRTESSTALNISWLHPRTSRTKSSDILDYKLCIAHERSLPGECEQEIVTKMTSVSVGGLRPATIYICKIAARNVLGFGRYGVEHSQMTNAAAPELDQSTITKETFVIHLQTPRREVSMCQIVVVKLSRNGELPADLSQHSQTYDETLSSHDQPSSYVAAEFDTWEFVNYKQFTIGDGRNTSALSLKRENAMKEYFNGPLKPDTKYTVIQRFFINQKLLYSSDFIPPVTTKKDVSSSQRLEDDQSCRESGSNVPFIVVTILLVLVLVTVVMVVLVWRQRRARNHHNNASKRTKDEQTPITEESKPNTSECV